GGVLVGLVGRAVQDGDAHDDQLAQIAGQRIVVTDAGQVREPAARDGRAVQQHLVQMQHAAALGDDLFHQGGGIGGGKIGVRQAGHGSPRQKPALGAWRGSTVSMVCVSNCTMRLMSSGVQMKGGASKIWSPYTPSMVPPMG